jgi:hypothetical protein
VGSEYALYFIIFVQVATVVKWLMKLSLLPFQDKSLWFPTLVIDLKMEIHNIFFDLMLLILMIILRYLCCIYDVDLFEFCCCDLVVQVLVVHIENMNILFTLSWFESIWFPSCLMMTSICRIE